MAKDLKAKKTAFLKKVVKKAKKKAPMAAKPGSAAEEKAEGEPTGGATGTMSQKYSTLATKGKMNAGLAAYIQKKKAAKSA
jgi:hypothetical protein